MATGRCVTCDVPLEVGRVCKRCPDCQRAYFREWKAANPDRLRATKAAYYWSGVHLLRHRFWAAQARARKYGAEGTFTANDWRELVAEYDNRCAYCRKRAKLTIDHVVPLQRGGRHDRTNILPACIGCNGAKKGMTPEEWARAKEPKDKRCTNCRKRQPLTEFYRAPHGVVARCKSCVRAKMRALYHQKRSRHAAAPLVSATPNGAT